MDRIRGQITKPVLIGAGVGLVVGLILGLIFAWGIWPVQWVNAGIDQLRPDLQRDYLVMSIQNFAQTGNAAEAQQRWTSMGADKQKVLTEVQTNPPAALSPEAINSFAAVVQVGGITSGAVTPAVGTTPSGATPLPGATPVAPGNSSNPLGVVLIVLCVLTLLIGGLLVYLFVIRNRNLPMAASIRQAVAPAASSAEPENAAVYEEASQEPPIVQYLTTYNTGNDVYNDSFSIDSPTGEFLGECGVEISETIGVGDPKKVTAFEVWLFDKNDIQTVTKVLMSEHAFEDVTINQRLASKGEPVLAEPGKQIILETATLQLQARVVNMNYGQGALPGNSYFDQLTLELAVWPKTAA